MSYNPSADPLTHMSKEAGGRILAHVLSRGALALKGDDVMAILLERYGVAAKVLVPTVEGQNGFVLVIDGSHILVLFMDFPMLLDGLQSLHGDKRNADGPVLDHCSHAMISLLKTPEDHAAKLRAILALVQVIATVAEGPGASAVLWLLSQTLLPVGQFQKLTRQWTAFPDVVPILLFARVVTYQDGEEDGKVRLGLFGVGFTPFIGREIEFEPQPRLFQELVYAFELVSGWSLAKGPVFGDGDTCGTSPDEVIRIHHRNEGIFLKAPILLCRIEKLQITVN